MIVLLLYPAMITTPTLLIVDDCLEDRKIYCRYLLGDSHQSYRIVEADSAEKGLSLCQKLNYDLILLDFSLPQMNGLEFLEQLKQQQGEIPGAVIMLTGQGNEEVAVQAMKRGVQDYLVKQHLKPEILQLAVRHAIKHFSLQSQLNKTQERQRLIATTALRIRQSLNLEQVLHTAVLEVQQLLKCEQVAIYQLDPELGNHLAAEVADPIYHTALSQSLFNIFWPSKAEKNANWEHKKTIIQVYGAGLSNGSTQLLEQVNLKDNLVVPITLNNHGDSKAKIWGLLVAYQCSPGRQWQADEIEMLNEVSVQLALAIQQAELLAMTQAALEKEKQLNGLKSQIIATVSHEYRTPLATILAAASTLHQNRHQLPQCKQERFLQLIEDKARHLSNLADDMLLVNQIEQDKTKFQPVSLDLLQFFAEMIEEFRLTADTHHELRFQVTGNLTGFWGDCRLLRLIFDNLVSNAIKYSPHGAHIDIHLMGNNSQASFSVKDQGIGIPQQELANLFQSFHRGSNVGTIPGTGLGLAIAKACVDLHGGEIALESQLGTGTQVTVSLPKRPLVTYSQR